ncbi:2-hydroxy-3-oxopropionate reductase [Sphingomonas sp. Tas61C01]|uniref:2-hydroxy-3-oxopropionate reductase n=1 Tax=Sphingomonas sp. Tas61C01 TaxID=3458297 RepID=UPI00403EBF6D
MKIGFLGLGIMGRPMAGHLQAAGHELLVVQHRSPLPSELLEGGAVICADAGAISAGADVIVLMLPDTPDVERALFGADGVVAGLKPGTLVIDMSSIDPIATKGFAARVVEAGGRYVDAPVSGGEVGAKGATLTIMVGGSEADIADALPLFELMGKNITRVGEVGSGQIAKVANQIIVGLNIAAVAEALVFAAKAGADPEKVRQALQGGFASSRILDVHGERMTKRTFDPGFRIALHRKDLALALNAARSLSLSLPNTAATAQLMGACDANGHGQKDHSALVLALELLANHSVA